MDKTIYYSVQLCLFDPCDLQLVSASDAQDSNTVIHAGTTQHVNNRLLLTAAQHTVVITDVLDIIIAINCKC